MLQNFIPIPASLIPEDTVLDFDIYRSYGSGKARTTVLAFPRHLPITPEARYALERQEIETLYLQRNDRDRYRKYIEKNLDHMLAGDDM